jgi:transcriptional regulator with XRE-family HTH domain
MAKTKTLFEKEMEKTHFKVNFEREYQEFQLEIQLLQALEDQGLTYEKFAEKIGTSKGNVARDLKTVGLRRATLDRVVRMAQALNLEFIPLLLPKERKQRKKKLAELMKVVAL